MKNKLQLLLIWFYIACWAPSFAQQTPVNLIVHVTGATADTGQVILSVYTSTENYLKTPLLNKIRPVNGEGEVWFTIENLETGKYSVGIVYDMDGNGELKTGFMRIPKEPVGFSNNAKSRFGPPGFDKTSFDLSESKTIVVRLDTIN